MTRHEVIEQVDIGEIIRGYERERLTQLERENELLKTDISYFKEERGGMQERISYLENLIARPWYRRLFIPKAEKARILKEKGENHFFEGRYREAVDLYERAIKLIPNDANWWQENWLGYFSAVAHIDALQSFEKTFRQKPDNHLAWDSLGAAYAEIGKQQKAIDVFKKTIELNPRYAMPYIGLGDIHRKQGKYGEAIKEYEKALKLNPNLSTDTILCATIIYAYKKVASHDRSNGKHDKAIENLKKAIELKPDFADAWSDLGIAYKNSKQFPEALEALRKAIELNPRYAEPYIYLGDIYYGQDQYNEAIKEYEKALKLNPNLSADTDFCATIIYTYKKVASHDRSNGKHDKAIENLKKAIELNPRYAELYGCLGDIYFEQGQYDEATKEYRKILPERYRVYEYIGLAEACHKMGRYAESDLMLDMAKQILPNDAELHFDIAKFYRCRNRYAEAEKDYKRAIELNPSNPYYHERLGWMYFMDLRNYQEAERELKVALELKPNDPNDITQYYALPKVREHLTQMNKERATPNQGNSPHYSEIIPTFPPSDTPPAP